MRKAITVRLEEDSVNELKRLSEENGISQSKMLEYLIQNKGYDAKITQQKNFTEKYIKLINVINSLDDGKKNILYKALEDLLCLL